MFSKDSIYHGFKLKNKIFIDDIESDFYQFEHLHSGARVVALKNNDSNKLFSISFRTLPENSTGTAHIMEHCVLNGSVKFPSDDLFNEITKGSMLTFINALTGSDKTFYPFSTRNSKEYFNIMDIYLDVVFNPLLEKNTFLREGWHYELDENENLTYTGIVYNEMKGAFSDPLRKISYLLKRELFRGSSYGFESGGYPADIPNLTYEQFLEFHKKFYSPSNSTIIIYGNEDLNTELEKIDRDFLSKTEKNSETITFTEPEKIDKPVVVKEYYPSTEQDTKNKTMVSIGIRLDNRKDIITSYAISMLIEIILRSESSPLRRALMDSSLCNEFTGFFDNSIKYPYLKLFMLNTEEKNIETLLNIYRDELDKIVNNGLDKEWIESEITPSYFEIMENSIDSSRGYVYMLEMITSLNFNEDVSNVLNMRDTYSKVIDKLYDHEFVKDIIKNLMSGLDRSVTIIMEPVNNKENVDENNKAELEEIKKSMSSDELENIRKITNEINDFKLVSQTKLPSLGLEDLELLTEKNKLQKTEINGVECTYTNEFCNDICFISLGFKLENIPAKYLVYLDFLGISLTELGTKKRDFSDLSKDIKRSIGGYSSYFQSHTRVEDHMSFTPYFWLDFKFLKDSELLFSDVLNDMILETNCSNKSRVQETMNRNFLFKDRSLQSDGYSFLVYLLKSNTSLQGVYSELINGISSLKVHKNILADYKKNEKKFLKDLMTLKSYLFNKNNLMINWVCDERNNEMMRRVSQNLIQNLPDSEFINKYDRISQDIKKNSAILTNSNVLMNGLGENIYDCGLEYHGSFDVMKSWLTRDFLIEEIRSKGGAYGADCRFNDIDGFMGFFSYRDPNLTRSFETYKKIPEAIRKLEISDELLLQLKIGSYSEFDPLLNPFSNGRINKDRYLSGIEFPSILNAANEILETTVEEMRSYSEVLGKLVEKSVKCSVGDRSKILKEKDIFDELVEY
ncbi:MAG: insulinase family protein [Candidatus Delongbacteria bacterium]|nr:insulinase family protein [Candidatus Delongbacteria bacterium]MBN2837090.1 insulinase family protein [Candidatus Delongbacteria bacterium]